MHGVLQSKLIRDHIVVGIRDRKLSEKLQLKSDLTLDSPVTEMHQSEAMKKQQGTVRSSDQLESPAVGSVRAQSHIATPSPQRKCSQVSQTQTRESHKRGDPNHSSRCICGRTPQVPRHYTKQRTEKSEW